MALARLAARLRAHDWTAAAIELVIVVAGILIALQVSNWNDERHDRARADTYLRRLHEGLQADARSMDTTLAFWRQVSAYFAIFNTNVTTVFSSLPKVWNLIGNGINNGYAYLVAGLMGAHIVSLILLEVLEPR